MSGSSIRSKVRTTIMRITSRSAFETPLLGGMAVAVPSIR
jgi:hypothetical protein